MIYFETLFSNLLHKYYITYPEALPSTERLLSLSALRELGSIEDAEKYLVDKEVDSVLRHSTKDQISYLKQRLKLDLSFLETYLDDLVELSQRRNLLVHNGAIINRTYLSNVSPDLIEKYSFEEGDVLDVDEQYIINAIDIVYLCGVVLIQQGWRKWAKEDVYLANNVLSDSNFDTLTEERYTLTERLSKYAYTLDLLEDRTSRIAVINHAISLKQMDKNDEMEDELKKHDWTSSALDFQVALLALRNDTVGLIEIIPRAIAAEKINKKALVEWPLFKELRNTSHFEEMLKLCDE